MKSKILMTLFLVLSMNVASAGGVQLFGVSPYSSLSGNAEYKLSKINPDGSTESTIDITYNGTTITGANGLVVDTIDSKTVYIMFKHDDLTNDRALGTLDINTGVVTYVGDSTEKIAGITMGNDGQMYAVTGDGSPTSESLFMVDKTDGSLTFMTALGDGNDGETIGFNSDNGLIYTRSGRDSDPSFMSIDPTASPLAPVQVGGVTLDEAFSLLYDIDTGTFLEANLDLDLINLAMDGSQVVIGSTDSYFKGMIFFPRKQDFIYYDGFETVVAPPVQ